MKRFSRLWMLVPLFLALLWPGWGRARPEATDDRTLSPYFFVKSDDPQLDRLPLKSTYGHGPDFRRDRRCARHPGL